MSGNEYTNIDIIAVTAQWGQLSTAWFEEFITISVIFYILPFGSVFFFWR